MTNLQILTAIVLTFIFMVIIVLWIGLTYFLEMEICYLVCLRWDFWYNTFLLAEIYPNDLLDNPDKNRIIKAWFYDRKRKWFSFLFHRCHIALTEHGLFFKPWYPFMFYRKSLELLIPWNVISLSDEKKPLTTVFAWKSLRNNNFLEIMINNSPVRIHVRENIEPQLQEYVKNQGQKPEHVA